MDLDPTTSADPVTLDHIRSCFMSFICSELKSMKTERMRRESGVKIEEEDLKTFFELLFQREIILKILSLHLS